jgi:hypothetical protein
MMGSTAGKMTLPNKPLWRLPQAVFALTLAGAISSVHAGWEFREPVKNPPPARGSADSATARPKKPARVQVFGAGRSRSEAPLENEPAFDPERRATAEAYAEMLKEDEKRVHAEEAVSDQELDRVRARIRTREVAEATNTETASDAVPAKPAPRTKAVPVPAKKTARPVPAMETEVITPQATPKAATVVPNGGGASARGDAVNPAFPYTHLLPSPFNLSQGEWVLGSTFAYGVVDFLQVSTNIPRLIQQHWNIRAKVPLIEYPTFVASAYVDYESYNPHNIDDTNPDMRLNRWQPGLITGYEIAHDMAVFLGGNFSFGKDPIPVRTTSGYMKGAQVEVDWSWLYNPSTSRLGDNALSAGVTYDLTYSLLGFGATHHWRNFSLGLHYTIADRARFLPIFGFNVAAGF